MLDTVETAPLAVRRDRSEARRAARQAKVRRERRIVEFLNRGVSIAEIAELEDVGEKHMRALVRYLLAGRMPQPPVQFIATQVNRLEVALRVDPPRRSTKPTKSATEARLDAKRKQSARKQDRRRPTADD